MTSGDAAAAVVSMLDLISVVCGVNLAQAASPKGTVLIMSKYHFLILFGTASRIWIVERQRKFCVDWKADMNPIAVPEHCVDEPLLVV